MATANGESVFTTELHEEDTVPRVPNYTAPLSMKLFLRRYFNVALVANSNALPQRTTVPHAAKTICVPPCNDIHAIYVYVSVTAPPPPTVEQGSDGHEVAQRTPPPMHPDFGGARSDRLRPGEEREAPNDDEVQKRGRVLSTGIVTSAVFGNIFAEMGGAFTAFVVAYCPIVVQVVPRGGFLHVMGPSLSKNLNVATKYKSIAITYQSNSTHPDRLKRRRNDLQRPTMAPYPPPLPSSVPMANAISIRQSRTQTAELFRRNLPRDALLYSLQRAAEKATTATGVSVIDLFLLRRPLPPVLSQKQQGGHNTTTPPQHRNGKSTSKEASQLLTEASAGSLAERVFAVSLDIEKRKKRQNCGNEPPHYRMSVQLRNLMRDFLLSVLAVDLRGLALKHFNKREEKARALCDATPAGVSTRIDGLLATHGEVVAFLRDFFSRLRVHKTDHEIAEEHIKLREDPLFPTKSSQDQRFTFFGTNKNVDAMANAVKVWLSAGKRGNCKASLALQGVSVGDMPHFRNLCGGVRRSQNLQRMLCEFQIFLFSEVLPLVITSAFHVTWSPKQQQTFCFIPKGAWDIVRRREVSVLKVSQEMCALEYATARELWHKTAASPLGVSLIYAAVRFLPDGKKLRPIATIRCATGGSLVAMVKKLPKKKPRCENGHDPGAAPTKKRASTTPNTTMLRKALFCLIAGAEEKRRLLGAPKFSNRTHRDEYTQIASFIVAARRALCGRSSLDDQPSLYAEVEGEDDSSGAAAVVEVPRVVLSFIRADGQRCYDRLPQAAVVDAINRLVPHDLYYRVRFRAALRCRDRGPQSTTTTSSAGDPHPVGGAASWRLAQRTWFSTIPKSLYDRGFIADIPSGWIVEETQIDEELQGVHIKEVLLAHVKNHLVSVNGKLFVQRVGITQGSSVAMLLCDELLQRVDNELASILSEHEEPSLLLRRVDDVLVATLSAAGADRCEERFLCGWHDVGFVSNPAKLQRTTTVDVLPTSSPDHGELVPWCGIMIRSSSLECSIDWGRFARYNVVSSIMTNRKTEAEIALGSIRLIRILWMRAPLTVFCGEINSRRRVLQTILECCGVWAHCIVELFVNNGSESVRPHPRLLLRSLNLARGSLITHLRRMAEQLAGLQRSSSQQQQHQTSASGVISPMIPLKEIDVDVCLWICMRCSLTARFDDLLQAQHPKRFLCLLLAVCERRVREVAPLPNWPNSAAHLGHFELLVNAQLATVPVQHFGRISGAVL